MDERAVDVVQKAGWKVNPELSATEVRTILGSLGLTQDKSIREVRTAIFQLDGWPGCASALEILPDRCISEPQTLTIVFVSLCFRIRYFCDSGWSPVKCFQGKPDTHAVFGAFFCFLWFQFFLWFCGFFLCAFSPLATS